MHWRRLPRVALPPSLPAVVITCLLRVAALRVTISPVPARGVAIHRPFVRGLLRVVCVLRVVLPPVRVRVTR